MRWPLRNQILLPMVGLMLAALIGVSVLNAYLSVRRTRQRIENDLAQVTETLVRSSFPLTDNVLQQMRGLAGAEFILTNRVGTVTASSSQADAFEVLPVSLLKEKSQTASPQAADSYDSDSQDADSQLEDKTLPTLARPIMLGQRRFFHTGVELRRFKDPAQRKTLHILYPEESYLQAWRDVVYPPLLVGGAATVLVVGFGLGIASRVTRPLNRLQRQVGEIARGNFRSVPVPKGNDEIADLSRSVNLMAEMLTSYETDVRRNEQLRTLGQLGGGIAHQIRNSVTGCRMALELHARECSVEQESLDVAMRQLELMEKFLQGFLSLGRSEAKPPQTVELQPIVKNVVSLVGPTARHVGVGLEWDLPDEPVEVQGDADALEQLLVNLVLNGVEAASQLCDEAARAKDSGAVVKVLLRCVGDHAELVVEDSGSGPPVEVEARLFDPFVTQKPDGTGLGLAVAREIVMAHAGRIRWSREDDTTSFVAELPLGALREATR